MLVELVQRSFQLELHLDVLLDPRLGVLSGWRIQCLTELTRKQVQSRNKQKDLTRTVEFWAVNDAVTVTNECDTPIRVTRQEVNVADIRFSAMN